LITVNKLRKYVRIFCGDAAKNRAFRFNAPEDGRLSAFQPLYTAQTFSSLSPVLLVKSHAVRVVAAAGW
jgi:hypothetical protein